MKTRLSKTYYEVRTKGDGEFDWFSVPATTEDGDEFYDTQNLESAQKYAAMINGFVVEVTEKTIDTHNL